MISNNGQHSDFAESLNTSQSLLNPPSNNDWKDFTRSLADVSIENVECIHPNLPNVASQAPSKLQHLDPDEIKTQWVLPACPPSPVPQPIQCAKTLSSSNLFFETVHRLPTDVLRASTKGVPAKGA
mmetsp:Transcript_26988/g.38695  ORF Transcript_26988/g.38695 Transcript_26988/m.38695 type:complete len:126 (-) Transcript_26988:218-595(-)|eukprot:CAMPEP_0172418760 /NCGR_PEP_ID=MMETSP1064-20121228/5204_1 /TAXON_ID=202472 /ORGANISM="Aulacoseira subarctica , Strain CCAP 1002/5" /LENGTH=125 /DNA_ID=CAMNT_0013157829 /DNA_START=228 /DNA_END=605 /DNA_ORIENTATION=-